MCHLLNFSSIDRKRDIFGTEFSRRIKARMSVQSIPLPWSLVRSSEGEPHQGNNDWLYLGAAKFIKSYWHRLVIRLPPSPLAPIKDQNTVFRETPPPPPSLDFCRGELLKCENLWLAVAGAFITFYSWRGNYERWFSQENKISKNRQQFVILGGEYTLLFYNNVKSLS